MKLKIYILIYCISLSALANLQVLPTRLVLNKRSKSSSLLIKNKGEETKEYNVDLVYYKMNANGKLVLGTIENDDSAVSYIKYSPKKIKLNPGEEQIVRVLYQSTVDLMNRDYRCHIQFNPINNYIKKNEDNTKNISFELKPRIGVAVPIFINNFIGERKSEIVNSKLLKKNNQFYISFDLVNNETNSFLVGDVNIVDQNEKIVATLNGVNTYIKSINLELSLGASFKHVPDRKLYINFKSAEAYGNKELARAEVLY